MTQNESREALAQEIATLKADLVRLKEDVGAALSDAGTVSKETLRGTKEKLHAAIESIQKRFATAAANVKDYSKEAVDKSRQKIVENPFIAVGGAFLAGVLVTMLVGKIRHGRSD
jgi:ElaB/YqjD/DUF883 family membrane-anchored ribosome-binding protein